MHKNNHEPLFHIVKRGEMPWYYGWGIRAAALVMALICCGVISSLVTGEDPIGIYAAIIDGSFGSTRKLWVLLQNTAMLLCIALALTPAFRMRFWNLGGEGQALAGALASAACMILLKDMPNAFVITCMVISSIIAGAAWGIVPAIFKARFNTNETLFSLMMNYVAIQLVAYFSVVWENPKGSGNIGVINPNSMVGWFPQVGSSKYLLNVIIVAVLTVVMFVYLNYTKHGYEISVVGESENTARYAGIDVKKVTLRTLLISGAICGLCGFITVAGNKHTIATNTAAGNGFTAIIVAWLAKFNTFYMELISFLLIFLEKGAGQIASTYGMNEYICDIISGIILFCILGSEFFINYRVIFAKHSVKGGKNK